MMRARRIRGMAGALRETQQRVSGHVAVRRRFKTVAVETRGLRLHYVRVKLSCGQSHKVSVLFQDPTRVEVGYIPTVMVTRDQLPRDPDMTRPAEQCVRAWSCDRREHEDATSNRFTARSGRTPCGGLRR